jgi:hypothetical protein
MLFLVVLQEQQILHLEVVKQNLLERGVGYFTLLLGQQEQSNL